MAAILVTKGGGVPRSLKTKMKKNSYKKYLFGNKNFRLNKFHTLCDTKGANCNTFLNELYFIKNYGIITMSAKLKLVFEKLKLKLKWPVAASAAK